MKYLFYFTLFLFFIRVMNYCAQLKMMIFYQKKEKVTFEIWYDFPLVVLILFLFFISGENTIFNFYVILLIILSYIFMPLLVITVSIFFKWIFVVINRLKK